MPTPSPQPLHREPAPPTLESQDATAQGADGIAQAALWRYQLVYWHEHAAQDEVLIGVSFNVPPASDLVDGAPLRVDRQLIVRLDYSEDGEYIHALRLQLEDAVPEAWPNAEYRSPNGGLVNLGPGSFDGAERTYTFDPPMPFEGWFSRIALTWNDLNVASMQNARATICVVRNRGLVAESASAAVVVYRTTTVEAPGVATPLNRWPQDIDISSLGTSVKTALDAALVALFGQRWIGQVVTMGFAYGYHLSADVPPESQIAVYLPVGVSPKQPMGSETSAQIAALLADWKETVMPATTGGHWAISLLQFSQLETAAPRPLLDLGRLVYRISQSR